MSASVLLLTVSLALALGILSAYGVVVGILRSFASQPKPAETPVLVASQARAAHAGGD